MAPSSSEEETYKAAIKELVKIRKAISGHKMQLANIRTRLNLYIEQLKTVRNDFILSTVNRLFEKFADQHEKIVELYTKILSMAHIETNQVEKDSWSTRLKDQSDDYIKLEKTIQQLMEVRPGMEAEGTIPRRTADNLIVRPIESLRPNKLKSNHNPLQCRSWTQKMESFLESSRIYECSSKVQIAFMQNCLDEDIFARVTTQMEANQGAKVMLTKIKEDWKSRFPLQNRRLELFKATKQGYETTQDFITRLKALSDEADLANLKDEQILTYICLSGLDDKKLRENILKLDNPSLEEIQKSAMSYENMVKQETMLDSRSQNYTRRTFRRQKTFDKRNKSKGRLSRGSERNTYRSVDRQDL